jgi:hypothetical protein
MSVTLETADVLKHVSMSQVHTGVNVETDTKLCFQEQIAKCVKVIDKFVNVER